VVALPDGGVPGEDRDAGTSPNGVVALLALPGEDGEVGISTTGVPWHCPMMTPCQERTARRAGAP
jgi:hypothetical protein